MVDRSPAGAEHALRSGPYEAAVMSVGASLRTLTFGGRNLVVPFAADELRPSYRGTTLAPWPNRIVNGRYTFGDANFQLPLTEPARSSALHGLVCWLDFHPLESTESRVVLTATIEPQAGYPWRIRVETTYSIDRHGLTQTVRATNLSRDPAPWGTAPHPYLVAGDGSVDEWSLELPAALVLEVTDEQLAPTRLREVDAGDAERFDFRSARPIGTAQIDHAYTGLTRSDDGSATVRLTEPSGDGVAMSWGADCPWVQIHTADLPGTHSLVGHRAGLAVEPMTCAPDAFNARSYEHDTGLLVLEPGASAEASWTISAVHGA